MWHRRVMKLATCAVLLACSSSASPRTQAFTVSPAAAGAIVGASVGFAVTPPTAVQWSVDEASGCGSITSAGVYSAPLSPATCHVTATALSDRTLQAHAQVNVFADVAGTFANITPPGVSLNQSDFGGNNYGMQTIALSPVAPRTLYVGTCYQGIWKSTDSGLHWSKVNIGSNGPNLDTGRNWTLAVDPTDANVVYTVAGFGSGQGIWKSTNGGIDWSQTLPSGVQSATTADIYSIAIDPSNRLHLLVGSHSGWNFGPDAGVLESLDGGQSWVQHPPRGGWGAGHYVFFIDSTTWLLCTQGAGIWRTDNSGASWTQVSTANMQHGADQLYRTSNGVLYLGATGKVLRSTDNGVTWSDAGAPHNQDGYNAIIGDGTYLYAQTANTGASSVGTQPYYYTLETDGTTWKPYNTQTFSDGPMAMAVDRANGLLFSSNWRAGVWRLPTGH